LNGNRLGKHLINVSFQRAATTLWNVCKRVSNMTKFFCQRVLNNLEIIFKRVAPLVCKGATIGGLVVSGQTKKS
jgi:hypothetical protein